MNLDEAISHCLTVSKKCSGQCSIDHIQLAKWLAELRSYRKLANDFKSFLNLNGINRDNFTADAKTLIQIIGEIAQLVRAQHS